MKQTIAKMYLNGEYRVTRDDSQKTNPYRVTVTWHNHGKHTKQLVRYADLASCMFYLYDLAQRNNQE